MDNAQAALFAQVRLNDVLAIAQTMNVQGYDSGLMVLINGESVKTLTLEEAIKHLMNEFFGEWTK